MGKKNLKQQMIYSIDNAFVPGVKKHTLTPGEAEQNTRIHSYQYRENLRDTACDFAKFARENYGIRMAKDLREEHAKAYLESKINECTPRTIEQYRSRLTTIGNILSDNYGYNIRLKTEPILKPLEDEKRRSIAMDRKDWEKVLEHGNDCQSKMALKMAEAFGLRVSEAVKIEPRDIKENVLHIHKSKGGRDRDISIRTEHQREVLKELEEYREVAMNEPILKVQADSVNKYLHSTLKRLQIKQYDEHDTGVHAIRKMYATERYDELREEGKSHVEAWGDVSEELGHSRNREDLFKVYVVHNG